MAEQSSNGAARILPHTPPKMRAVSARTANDQVAATSVYTPAVNHKTADLCYRPPPTRDRSVCGHAVQPDRGHLPGHRHPPRPRLGPLADHGRARQAPPDARSHRLSVDSTNARGIGGVELADDGTAELKRFYLDPCARGPELQRPSSPRWSPTLPTWVLGLSASRPGLKSTPRSGTTLGTGSNTSSRSVPTSPACRRSAWPPAVRRARSAERRSLTCCQSVSGSAGSCSTPRSPPPRRACSCSIRISPWPTWRASSVSRCA